MPKAKPSTIKEVYKPKVGLWNFWLGEKYYKRLFVFPYVHRLPLKEIKILKSLKQ